MSLALLAIIFLIISFVLAVIMNDLRSPSLWALWAIAAALILGSANLG
jgi:hypothetical protein